MGACCMCMGTDCAGACAQGQCYAEEQQRWFAQQAAEEEAYWQQLYDDSLAASEIVGQLALATSDTPKGSPDELGRDG